MTQIIVFSNERPSRLTGDKYIGDKYQNILNTSLIKAVKEERIQCSYFGTYASAKNDLTEGGGPRDVYGIFLIFDFAEGKYYCIKSDEKAHISSVYKFVRDQIEQEFDSKYRKFFINTPLSLSKLEKIMVNPKNPRCVDFIEVSILHYIEEMVLNLKIN